MATELVLLTSTFLREKFYAPLLVTVLCESSEESSASNSIVIFLAFSGLLSSGIGSI